MYQPKARDLIIKWSDHKPLVIQALCYGSVQAMHQRVARDRAVSETPDVADVGVITVADAEHAIEVEYAKRRENTTCSGRSSRMNSTQPSTTRLVANKTPLALEDPRLVPASLFSQSNSPNHTQHDRGPAADADVYALAQGSPGISGAAFSTPYIVGILSSTPTSMTERH